MNRGITPALLSALLVAQDARHYGYDMSKAAGLRSGTSYPILMGIEGQGWLEARWEAAARSGKPPRHLYRLTATSLHAARLAAPQTPERFPFVEAPA